MDNDQLISTIYSAATDDLAMEQSLALIAKSVGAHAAGFIFQESPLHPPQRAFFHNVDSYYWGLYEEHYYKHDLWLDKAIDLNLSPGELFIGSQRVPENQFRQSTGFNEFFKLMDIGDAICVTLPVSPMQVAVLSFWNPAKMRSFNTEQIMGIKRLLPHLLSSFVLRGKLEEQTIKSLFFEQASNTRQPAWLLLNLNGEVLHTTHSAEQIFSEHDGVFCTNKKLCISDANASVKIRQTLFEMRTINKQESSASLVINVKRPSYKTDYILQMCPLLVRDHVFLQSGYYAQINIIDPEKTINIKSEILEDIYNLTPREAEIAIAIAQGKNLKAIATTNRVAVGTARNQLKAALHKTDSATQSDLAALLAKLPLN